MAESGNGAPPQVDQTQRPQSTILPYEKLLKPEQIPNLPLTEEQKKRFGSGVAQFWSILKSKPKEDPQHREVLGKLSQLTFSIMGTVRQNNAQKVKQQQQNQEQQAQPSSSSQPNQRPPSQGQHQSNEQSNSGVTSSSQQQSNPTQPSNANEVPEQIRQLVENASSQWLVPTNHQTNPQAYKDELKKRYAASIYQKERSSNALQQLAARIQQMRSQNHEVPSDLVKQQQQIQQQHAAAERFIREINTQQTAIRNQHQQQQSQQAARNASGPMINGTQSAPQQQQSGVTGGATGGSGMQNGQQQPQRALTGQNATVEAVRQQQQQQQANRQASAASPTGTSGQGPNSASLPQQSQHPPQFPKPSQNNGQTTTSAFPQTSPQSGMQPNPSSQGTGPFNQQGGLDSARSFSSNGNITQPGINPVTGQQFNTTTTDKPNASSRWTMSKNFNPQAPTPVPMGPTRPTMAGPNNGPIGPVGQPAIQQQPPPINLYGNGGHVLGRKKLDELARQICGPSDPNTPALHPEVEESILEATDEFFDDVIGSACRLAKARGSNVLDVRDVELVLQRQYNIRIPGYSTDEVRTVRKQQPTPAYFQKVNAVQAAKMMGGKGD